jgi:hypothetical protein
MRSGHLTNHVPTIAGRAAEREQPERHRVAARKTSAIGQLWVESGTWTPSICSPRGSENRNRGRRKLQRYEKT